MNSDNRPIVIAHRGASGYLPEHTLPAKALAYAMGADYLEQDVVASRDDELIVLHDIYLDRVTDVAERFPGRARDDGRFYVRDFDFAELLELSVWERMDARGEAVYPDRFPARSGAFRLHTLADELELVRSLNDATGGHVGVYPEIKRPEWHREAGVDIAPLFLADLQRFGYTTRTDNAFVQCFDASELERIRHDLESDLRLVQLIGENSWGESSTDYSSLRTEEGLRRLAKTVDGIGPSLNHLYSVRADTGSPEATDLAAAAHAAGLVVHPYTARLDSLPDGFTDFDALIGFLFDELRVDGVFTDFPDLVRHAIDMRA